MTPEYKPIEKGIVIREVKNPKPISEFPEADRRDMYLRYTVKQMIREGYTDMSFVELNTVISYELVPEEGFDNLYDAYVDWWERLNQESVGFIITGVYNAVNPLFMDTTIKLRLQSKKAVEHFKLNAASYRDTYGSLFIDYTIKRGKGYSDLWQAYMAWWNKNERLTNYWNGEVLKVPTKWIPKPFYPINPIEEKENTMQFKISRNQISNQIKKIEESLKNQKTRIISELNSIEEKISNGEPISGNLKEYRMYDLILRQLNYLKSFENVVEIICSEEEKDKIFKEIPCSSIEE